MLYDLECWAVDRRIEQNMSVPEMRKLKWISGVTRADRIRNKFLRGSIDEALIEDTR